MGKTTKAKAKKSGKKNKGVRISIAQKTQEAAKTKAGLHKEVVAHFNLPQEADYHRTATNTGLRREEHSVKMLNIHEAVKALNIDTYDENKKRRAEVVAFIKSKLGSLKKGDVVAWLGRNRDTKAGSVNECAKYFFSNAKSAVNGIECKELNYFSIV